MSYESWGWEEGYFHPKENPPEATARFHAIRAIKRELRWLGYISPTMTDTGFYGTEMGGNVKAFQTSVGLTPDGVIGPRTMKALCKKRVLNFEAASEVEGRIAIPDHLLCRLLDLESDWYPACRNTTEDYGIAQIHEPLEALFVDGTPVCPDGDWQYTYRIGVNVRVAAEGLRSSHRWLAGYAPATTTDTELWRAAVMAHNAPAWARDWLIAGFPTTGGGTVTVGDWQGEKYEWCSLYTRAVYARGC